MIKCTILGCGGSLGVPQLRCQCYVCASSNPKNTRMRTSIFLESASTKILVDTSPDLKTQAYQHNIGDIDAVLYTHEHSDHISGINDLKPLVPPSGKIQAYLHEDTYKSIYGTYRYLFDSESKIYKTILHPNLIDGYSTLSIGDITITSFIQHHGEINSLGFRFGSLAYSTDLNHLPERSLNILQGVDTWIVGCLRYSWSPTHFNYEEMLSYVEKLKPKRVILTHMAHEIDYDEIAKMLPASIEPAYDGMVIGFAG